MTWLLGYLAYLAFVFALLLTDYTEQTLTPYIGEIPLERKIGIASFGGLWLSYFLVTVAFLVFGRDELIKSVMGRLRVIFSIFMLVGIILIELAHLHPLHHVTILLLLSVIATIFEYQQARNYVRGLSNTSIVHLIRFSIVDIPLVLGLAVLVIITHSTNLSQNDQAQIFLAGALALKTGYYYGAYSLLNFIHSNGWIGPGK
ncbi:MAG: hypothetical protein U0821_05920 [Chloroflexota bacterium]